MIAAPKQRYEHDQAEDLTELQKLLGAPAEDCVRSAELTVDTRRRAQYLKLAREWTEAADALEASTQ